MNLVEALQQSRDLQEVHDYLRRIEAKLAARDKYKVARYFHDCQPGCKVGSLKREDHVPLAGQKLPTCRILYVKHRAFMRAGLRHKERLFLAANRIGKTECAAFELRAHLTGLYPKWWQGRRFEGPIQAWAAGDTRQTTRDIIQSALMGPHEGVPTGDWSGMIDPHLVVNWVRSTGGVANCLDTVYVQHAERQHGAPCVSELGFKSYDQGRRVFQGTEKHLIWLDEEPPDGVETQEEQAQGSSDIWIECLLRTMTTDGLVMATFTPLRGMTPFLIEFLKTAWMPGDDDEDLDNGTADFDGLVAESRAHDIEAKAEFFPDAVAS